MQTEVHDRIRQTAKAIAESMGATVEVTIDKKTPVTHNTPELVERMLPSLHKAAGKDNVKAAAWVTGAEDFAFFQSVPSFYFFVGGMPKGMDPKDAAPHHTPDFIIDDSGLDVGVKAFANIVFDYAK